LNFTHKYPSETRECETEAKQLIKVAYTPKTHSQEQLGYIYTPRDDNALVFIRARLVDSDCQSVSV